jgi:hypothetical protein
MSYPKLTQKETESLFRLFVNIPTLSLTETDLTTKEETQCINVFSKIVNWGFKNNIDMYEGSDEGSDKQLRKLARLTIEECIEIAKLVDPNIEWSYEGNNKLYNNNKWVYENKKEFFYTFDLMEGHKPIFTAKLLQIGYDSEYNLRICLTEKLEEYIIKGETLQKIETYLNSIGVNFKKEPTK